MIKTINRLRRGLYRRGILRSKRVPAPVISVGNISMGGAGKTPAVIAIANVLAEHGLRVAVLTRGYGRSGEGGVVESLDAGRYGDEPVLIKKRTQNVAVIVGENRYVNALRHPYDVYILDDGFQHMQIRRDLDIVIDAPSKWYRESRDALAYADVVMPRDLRLAVPDSLRGKSVFAFAGLADNEQFFEGLRAAGLNVVGTRGFPDHHSYSKADLEALKRERADVLVTTEKDAVKIDDAAIVAIPADMHIPPEVMERVFAVVLK